MAIGKIKSTIRGDIKRNYHEKINRDLSGILKVHKENGKTTQRRLIAINQLAGCIDDPIMKTVWDQILKDLEGIELDLLRQSFKLSVAAGQRLRANIRVVQNQFKVLMRFSMDQDNAIKAFRDDPEVIEITKKIIDERNERKIKHSRKNKKSNKEIKK